jgi:hypothetical protein
VLSEYSFNAADLSPYKVYPLFDFSNPFANLIQCYILTCIVFVRTITRSRPIWIIGMAELYLSSINIQALSKTHQP